MEENMRKKEKRVGIIMAVVMSAAMGIIASIVIAGNPEAKTPPFPVFCAINLIESIIVGLLVAFIIPLGRIGKGLADKAGATPPSMKFNLINSIPYAIGNAVIVSAVVSFINIAQAHASIPAEEAPPLMAMWISGWLPLLLPGIAVSYVLAVIISPIVVGIVMGRR